MSSGTSNTRSGISGTEWALLWGSAMLFQYISQLEWLLSLKTPPITLRDIMDSLVVLSAGALLFAPRRAALLILMAGAQAAAAGLHLPDIPNHRLFSSLINLSIVLSAVSTLLRRTPLTIETLWHAAAPAIRSLLVTLYVFAGIAKFNTGYLNPDYSCASMFFHEMRLPISLPTSVHSILAIGSMIVELGLPILLILPATRRGGVLLGLIFHLVLTFDTSRHFLDFSSVATACLLAFSPGQVLSGPVIRRSAPAIVAGILVCIFFGSRYPEFTPVVIYGHVRNLLWFSYAAMVIGSYIVAGKDQSKPAERPLFIASRLAALPCLFAIYNGLTPYLGIKTKSSWDMYSNLRLEGPAPNHLLFGRGLDLFGEFEHPITVLKTSNPVLQVEYIDKGYDIVPFELRRIFSADPHGVSTFVYNGETYSDYPHGRGATPLSIAPSALSKQLFWFRPVDRQPEPRCQR